MRALLPIASGAMVTIVFLQIVWNLKKVLDEKVIMSVAVANAVGILFYLGVDLFGLGRPFEIAASLVALVLALIALIFTLTVWFMDLRLRVAALGLAHLSVGFWFIHDAGAPAWSVTAAVVPLILALIMWVWSLVGFRS